MSDKITLDWIVNELKQLKAVDRIGVNTRILYNKLLDFIKEKVADEISFSEFFAIAVGLRFTLELQQDQCYKIPGSSNLISRPIFPVDVDSAIKRLKKYWRAQFPLLNKQIKNSKNAHASKWLDVIFNNWESLMVERLHSIICYVTDGHLPKTIDETKSGGRVGLIANDLEKIIRYDEYGLCDAEEEAAKEIIPMIYGIDELERRWSANRKNIIAICRDKQNKIWPYLALSKKLHLKSLSLRLHASEIKEKITKGEVDLNYKYPYQEFARITKLPPSPGGVTLKHLLSDAEIETKSGAPTFFWVEPPLCERVLGVFSHYVDSDVSFVPELCFMQDEIHAFEKTQQFSDLQKKYLGHNIDINRQGSINKKINCANSVERGDIKTSSQELSISLLPKGKDRRGAHHSQTRINTYKAAIAVILRYPNSSFAKQVCEKVIKHTKKEFKILSLGNGKRMISEWINSTAPDSANKSKKEVSNNEKFFGLLLFATYRQNEVIKFDRNTPDVSIRKIATFAQNILEQPRDEQAIKEILNQCRDMLKPE